MSRWWIAASKVSVVRKVVDAQYMALDGDRGIRLGLPFTCAAGTQS